MLSLPLEFEQLRRKLQQHLMSNPQEATPLAIALPKNPFTLYIHTTKMYPSHIPQQVIEDFSLVCVSQKFPDSCNMHKHPVYFSPAVWELSQGQESVVCNICYLAAYKSTLTSNNNSATSLFSVVVRDAERTPDFLDDENPYYDLLAKIIHSDNSSPMTFILFPDEVQSVSVK